MSISDTVDVEVTLVMSYPLPADLDERERIYGATDPAECVQIDIDNDPVALLLESTLTLVSVAGGAS